MSQFLVLPAEQPQALKMTLGQVQQAAQSRYYLQVWRRRRSCRFLRHELSRLAADSGTATVPTRMHRQCQSACMVARAPLDAASAAFAIRSAVRPPSAASSSLSELLL